MTEAKIERLERAIWEITQLAQELDDMGYGTFASMIDDIVTKIEVDVQAAVEELDNVS
jgi:t-SNARE complex subunit (syntaxin)